MNQSNMISKKKDRRELKKIINSQQRKSIENKKNNKNKYFQL